MKTILLGIAALCVLVVGLGLAQAQDAPTNAPVEPAKPAEPVKPAEPAKPAEPQAEEKAPETATIDKQAPDFTLKDANGKEVKLSSFAGKIVVLEWVNYDCPAVVKHYQAGHMTKLQKEMRDAGAVWLSICSSSTGKQGHFEGEALLERIKKEGCDAGTYLIDTDGKVGKAYQAKTTPHMFVIDAKGVLRYQGAIDDNPRARGEQIAQSKNYVRDAVTALKDGKDVTTKETRPYG